MNLNRDEIQTVMDGMFQTTTWTAYDAELLDLFVDRKAAYAIYEVAERFQVGGQEPEPAAWNCFTRFVQEDGVWKVHRDVCGPRDAPAEG